MHTQKYELQQKLCNIYAYRIVGEDMSFWLNVQIILNLSCKALTFVGRWLLV